MQVFLVVKDCSPYKSQLVPDACFYSLTQAQAEVRYLTKREFPDEFTIIEGTLNFEIP